MRKSFLPISLATSLLASSILAQEATPPESKPAQTTPAVEICFVLDTTGSMGGLIDSAKRKVWNIANEAVSFKPKEIRFGLVGYRDRGDEYVTSNTTLTNDLDAVHTDLMKFAAGGGGDNPESVNQALHEAVTKMPWSSDSKVRKIIFLVGDAPPKMNYEDDVKYPEVVKLAKKKGIHVNAILCGASSQTATIWKEIAEGGRGQFAAIPQEGGTAFISTPFDERLNELSVSLNRTVACWGDHAQRATIKAKINSINEAPVENQATRVGYANRNFQKGQVVTGRGDLVNDWSNGAIKLEDITPEQLEGDLKGLTGKALEAKLNEKKAEREKLSKEVAELSKKRALFIKAEQKKKKNTSEEDSFDAKVTEMLKIQLGNSAK